MKKLFRFVLLALLIPICAQAAGWDDAEYQRIEKSILMPKLNDRQFLISSFGAKTTATAAQNQKAINRAVERWSSLREPGTQAPSN